MGADRYAKLVAGRLEEIKEWVGELNEEQIAGRLGISRRTLENYKKKYPELAATLLEGRKKLVSDLKATLKRKARGYEYTETKTTIRDAGGQTVVITEKYTKYAQPDTGAIHLLLKNLDPEWHNDDTKTLNLKKEQLEINRQRTEAQQWT